MLPRWAGYFNVWAALLFAPGIACYFFDDGPFAWRGVFVWWIPLTVFGVWFAVMTTVLLRAIDAQSAAEEPVRDRELLLQ